MKKDYTVLFVSPEMMIPELPEPACGANFRGGLGILSGDIMEGLARREVGAVAITPFYNSHWMTHEGIIYDRTPAQTLFEIVVNDKPVKVREIWRGGTRVLGLESDVFNVLYVADRWQRILQEVLLGHAVPAVLKKLDIKPDICWLNEGHTAITIPVMKEDRYFAGIKFLFTTHTPVPEGMEKFYGDDHWFNALRINREKYHSVFVKDGMIDMTRAVMILAETVNAVSQEHCEVTKRMFPEFSHKIVYITNGSSRELWMSSFLKELGEEFGIARFLEAQQATKEEFIKFLEQKTNIRFDIQKPILVWVRRIAWYKQQYPMLASIIRAICAEKGQAIETEFGRLEGLGFQVFGAGRAHESDAQCLGWMTEFQKWMSKPGLAGNFVFLPEYNLELLKRTAQGCDVWFSCPLPQWEACGTSDRRATINGKVNLTTRAGGAKEYIKDYNPITGEGNGFFIEPYEPRTVYNKLKIISDLYYAWMAKRDRRWSKLMKVSFEAGKALDVVPMIEKYEQIFENLLN